VQDPPPNWAATQLRALGDRLRTCRKAAGLTQWQLAERIGRDNKTISRWENGHRIPTALDLIHIAHALDIPLRDLVDVEK
jgi:transcriptional regulator with XRE-family HTH domain